MFKFKVGDRVLRVRHSVKVHNCPIGYQTVVTGLLGEDRPYGIWYTAPDGSRQNSSSPDDWDLVDPIGSPIRTVTRREPVSGKYSNGDVDVSVHPDGLVQISVSMLTRKGDRVRSACMVLSQLAEFLDEDKGDE